MNAIQLIVIGLVMALAVGYLLYRRSRSKASDSLDLPPPNIGDLVDYTSGEPIEPTSLADRFKALSLPGRILVGVLPLLLLGLGALLVFNVFLRTPPPPPAPPPILTLTKADLVNPTTISVAAQTENIPDGTELGLELLANDQPVEWFDDTTITGQVISSTLDMRVSRSDDAPPVDCSQSFDIRLSGSVNGVPVTAVREFFVPPLFRDEFCAPAVAEVPTRTPRPTAIPITPTATPATDPEPDIPVLVPADPEPGVSVAVGNGGNVRATPSGEGELVTQIALGDPVEVLGRLADSSWFRIRTADGSEGWTFSAALNPPADVIEQVPVLDASGVAQAPPAAPADPTATATPEAAAPDNNSSDPATTPTEAPNDDGIVQVQVGNGGNVRSAPSGTGELLTQIVLGQTVEVLGRLADNSWFRIRTPDGTEGWTSNGALNPPADVLERIPILTATGEQESPPVAAAPEPTATPAITAADLPDAAERTVVVFNSGQLHQEPSFDAPPAGDDLTTGETVELLAKTGDEEWFKVRTTRSEVGWAHNTVITVPPELALLMPIENPL
ncbi:MAG: SH3 domain-containing protein [Chloroflexaceae bacterium]|nr:SH3 domain-containing protein [Chloroflexaceae bacterium]